MATKVLIEIQGNMYDFWEFRSFERDERYNEQKEELEYLLVANRQVLMANYSAVEFPYDSLEEREVAYKHIKEQLDYFEGVLFINADLSKQEILKRVAAQQALVPQRQFAHVFTDDHLD